MGIRLTWNNRAYICIFKEVHIFTRRVGFIWDYVLQTHYFKECISKRGLWFKQSAYKQEWFSSFEWNGGSSSMNGLWILLIYCGSSSKNGTYPLVEPFFNPIFLNSYFLFICFLGNKVIQTRSYCWHCNIWRIWSLFLMHKDLKQGQNRLFRYARFFLNYHKKRALTIMRN